MKNKVIKLFGGLLVIVMLVSIIKPLIALAEGDLEFTFEVEDNTKYRLQTDGHHLFVITLGDKEESNEIETISDGGANISEEVTTECSSNISCTITITQDIEGVKFRYETSAFDITLGEQKISPSDLLTARATLSIKIPYNNPGSGGEGGENEPHFDGKAYVLWSCGNGVCYHYFSDIPDFDDGNSTFYSASEIEADNKPGTTFDVSAEYKGWYLADKFQEWTELYPAATGEDLDWNTLDPKLILGEPNQHIRELEEAAVNAHACVKPDEDAPGDEKDDFEKCLHLYAAEHDHQIWTHQLQPVGEPQYNNCYVSYGDRNFKVVIYNDEYKGVAMGDLEELHYYPAQWTNPFIKRDQFDISGTTKDKPALLDSILLESTVIIKALGYNFFAISSIEALDVPEDAVTITKDEIKDQFRIVFSSNFYDNVTFKVTDTKGEVSYMLIKRYTIDAWIRGEENRQVLTADFYFDKERSYNDFEITAKIVYKDGTTRNVSLEARYGIDDGLGNITYAYEVDETDFEFGHGGKGLKRATFECELEAGADKLIQDIYLNAEYKGSTESSYAGAYVGSGEGVLANLYHGEDE